MPKRLAPLVQMSCSKFATEAVPAQRQEAGVPDAPAPIIVAPWDRADTAAAGHAR